MKTRVVFRADGYASIGLGHVFRSLALAEMLRKEFECLFVINNPDPQLKRVILTYCKIYILHVSGIQEEFAALKEILTQNDIMVTDGYQFNEQYQKRIKSSVKKLVTIDDKAEMHFFADLVINHGDPLVKLNYKTEPNTIIATGFEHLIVRNEFLLAAKSKRNISKVDTVFVCMGGSDPFNITTKVLNAAVACDFIKNIYIVKGSAYVDHSELAELAEKFSAHKNIIIKENINAIRMVELVSQSEIAICPASSTALEVCCVKAGLLTGTVIDNQYAIHVQLLKSACCISVGDFNSSTVNEITQGIYKLKTAGAVQSLMNSQSKAIDGFSGERILKIFKQLTA